MSQFVTLKLTLSEAEAIRKAVQEGILNGSLTDDFENARSARMKILKGLQKNNSTPVNSVINSND